MQNTFEIPHIDVPLKRCAVIFLRPVLHLHAVLFSKWDRHPLYFLDFLSFHFRGSIQGIPPAQSPGSIFNSPVFQGSINGPLVPGSHSYHMASSLLPNTLQACELRWIPAIAHLGIVSTSLSCSLKLL